MSAFDLLQSWLRPLLDPLNDVRNVIKEPTNIHRETVATFASLVAGLYEGADAFEGDAANAVKNMTESYLHLEAQFSGAGTAATGTMAAAVLMLPAPTTETVLEDAADTSVECGVEVTEAASTAAAQMGADTGLDVVTEAVDVASVAQAGLDPVTDIPAVVLTVIDAGIKISILVALGWSIFNAVERWINDMNRLGHITWPPLPSFLDPYGGYNIPTPINQKLTPLQEQEVQDILANLAREGITGVSQSDIEDLVRLGYDKKTILAILRLKSAALLTYVKSTKPDATTLKDLLRAVDLAQRTIEDAKDGKIRRAANYHGRLPAELEQEILSNPDAIYVAKNGNFIFLKGGNIVVTIGSGSRRGAIVTSYGPGGPRGISGAKALQGGSPSDPGLPVTDDMIIKGEIARPSGENIPPATKILP